MELPALQQAHPYNPTTLSTYMHACKQPRASHLVNTRRMGPRTRPRALRPFDQAALNAGAVTRRSQRFQTGESMEMARQPIIQAANSRLAAWSRWRRAFWYRASSSCSPLPRSSGERGWMLAIVPCCSAGPGASETEPEEEEPDSLEGMAQLCHCWQMWLGLALHINRIAVLRRCGCHRQAQ